MAVDKSRKEKSSPLEATLRGAEQGGRWPIIPILDEMPEHYEEGHVWIIRSSLRLYVVVDGTPRYEVLT